MKFIDYLRLASKNLTRRKARTVLTILAITVGSLSVILMVSLLIGVRQSLIDTFKAMGAFNLVTVTPDPNATNDNPSLISSGNGGPSDEGKKLDDTIFNSLKILPNVVDATPIASVWAKTMKLEGQDKKIWSNLIAFKPETRVFDLPLLAGRTLDVYDMDKIVVGSRFVSTYGYAKNPQDLIGKKVIMGLEGGGGGRPDWGPLPEQPPMGANQEWWDKQQNKIVEIPAEIVGVANNATMDDSQNYIGLAWARKLMTQVSWKDQGGKEGSGGFSGMTLVKDDMFTRNGYGSIILKVNDIDNVKSVADSVGKMGYGATTAQNMIDQINKIFSLVSLVLGAIGGISLFVAAIGIINTMVMATYERTREIGVMRACGATQAIIRRLFTFEAAALGFLGGVFGMIISIILGNIGKVIATKYVTDMNIPLDNIGSFPWWLVLGVIAFTTLVGLLSGLGPAMRAAKLNPVDALRYE